MKNKRLSWHYRSGKEFPHPAKKVDRGSRWGNPYILKKHGGEYELEDSLRLYEIHLREKVESGEISLSPLIGWDLVCSCPEGEPCHGDIILKLIKEKHT
jgi:hypothetical protein